MKSMENLNYGIASNGEYTGKSKSYHLFPNMDKYGQNCFVNIS